MRVGFIGTGNFATQHAEILSEMGLKIRGCFGTNPAKTKLFSEKFNCSIFTNFLELIRKEYIDILYIVIPPFAHNGEIELAAIKNNIPFYCEKPIGLDLKICKLIANEIANKNLITSSGYQLRYEELFSKIKKILNQNLISTVRVCSYSYSPSVHWWRKQNSSGGMMVEQASHYLDLLRYLFGEAKSVFAFSNKMYGHSYFNNCDIDDSTEGIIKFNNNILASIGITHLLDTNQARNDMLEIYGLNFGMKIDLKKLRFQNVAVAHYQEDGDKFWKTITNPTSKTKILLTASKTFVNAILNNNMELVRSSYGDALRTLQLALAITKSIEFEKAVNLKV